MRDTYENFGKIYIDKFNRNWNSYVKHLRYKQHQLLVGNRLRPCIVLGGYLANFPTLKITDEEYNYIINISICVEIIHKVSLFLDDWIDNDNYRHGVSSFHIEYGVERTVMYALNLISMAIKKLRDTLNESSLSDSLRTKVLDTFLNTLYDMSLGELEELDLDYSSRLDISKIKKIMELETTPLIANSFLIGYFAGGGNEPFVEKNLHSIGGQCGYIFQALNDLEPFFNTKGNVEHKGKENIDFDRSKKNIAVSLLYKLLSKAEKDSIILSTPEDVNALLKKYMKKYGIKETVYQEVNVMKDSIHQKVIELFDYGINKDWCDLLSYFIDGIIQKCRSRVVD